MAVTAAEKAATDAFLTWVHAQGDWGRALAARAVKAKSWCEAK